MKIKVVIEVEVDIAYLKVSANVRYWEDGSVNGIDDPDGEFIPCRSGDSWCPIIAIESGKIVNWKTGNTAKVHYKVCDEGCYQLCDENMDHVLVEYDGYVPSCMSPGGRGYGDYIIMNIDEDGMIENWKFDKSDAKEFFNQE